MRITRKKRENGKLGHGNFILTLAFSNLLNRFQKCLVNELFDIGWPFKRILSFTLTKCGELKNPVFTLKLRRIDSTKAHVEPWNKYDTGTKNAINSI
jgi:hypothetical protein